MGLENDSDDVYVLLQSVDHESRVHIDIETDDIPAEVKRLESLGATVVAQVKEWTVMQAPSGQRFCVIEPDSEKILQPKPIPGNKACLLKP